MPAGLPVTNARALQVTFEADGKQGLRLQPIALDAYGNELALASGPAPVELPGTQAASGSNRVPRGWYAQWYTYGAAAVVAGGAGTFFALRSRADAQRLERLLARSADAEFAEAREIERRGRFNTLLANGGFAAAGALGVATVVCAVRGRYEKPNPVVAPVMGAGGATGLSVSGRF